MRNLSTKLWISALSAALMLSFMPMGSEALAQSRRYKTCTNVWGSYQVPRDKSCSAGADNVYQKPRSGGPVSRTITPPVRRGWKTCSNVWGTYQVPAKQSCSKGADNNYTSGAKNPTRGRVAKRIKPPVRNGWKTCSNVWGTYQERVGTPCKAGVGG